MPKDNAQAQPPTPQDERSGGYGDDTGMAEQQQATSDPRSTETRGDSAVGRENPAAGGDDADEALGNRVGGYGRGPEEEETD